MSKGWRNESERHSLSARGIRTSHKSKFVGDYPLSFSVEKGGLDNSFGLVGFVDGVKVGYITYRTNIMFDEMELDSLFVFPEFVGKGYGSCLMDELIGFADKHGFVVTLSVEPFGGEWETVEMDDYPRWLAEKERLRNYYKKFGFTLVAGTGSMMERLPQS